MNRRYFFGGLATGFLLPLLIASIVLYFFLRPPSFSLDELRLHDLTNNQVTASSLNGKPLLINFWATWCKPCLLELPDLLKAQDSLKGKETFVFVSDETTDQVARFVKAKGFKGLFVCTPLDLVQKGLKVRPATYFYDDQGKISDTHLGPLDYKTVMKNFR
jgi:thiol-disulfide isomerase/thioredoxin